MPRKKPGAEYYEVRLTLDAKNDLSEIVDYIAEHDSPAKADHVQSRIEEIITSLQILPERGGYPPEFQAIGIRDFRQSYFKPYRIIYRVAGNQVFVYLIADGRRDLQQLLQRRLLEQ